ncbi:hypothetical protein DFH29DRAFT_363257 [Suillus ampliporus]|nr:hypothetical protein DFH29DRAFT_363257 [Suillus ampliporus]
MYSFHKSSHQPGASLLLIPLCIPLTSTRSFPFITSISPLFSPSLLLIDACQLGHLPCNHSKHLLIFIPRRITRSS